MADDTNTNNNDTGNSSGMMNDTRTRKTLKLKPIKRGGLTAKDIDKPEAKTVSDPLTQRNTDTGPLEMMDDTRTRKTVKLKPLKPGLNVNAAKKANMGAMNTGNAAPAKVVDPLNQRNTDTGPLEAMDDTRTRKTVKLADEKKGGMVSGDPRKAVDPLTKRDTETGPLDTMDDTRTRKTVSLKSAGAAKNPADDMLKDTRTLQSVSLTPSQASGEKAEEAAEKPADEGKMMTDTRTRKTLKLKPVQKNKPIALTKKADEGDDTRTRKSVKIKNAKQTAGLSVDAKAKPVAKDAVKKEAPAQEAPKAEEVGDDTIKIQRPQKAAASGAAPGEKPAATPSNKETVKLRPPTAKSEAPKIAPAPANKETIKLSPKPKGAEEAAAPEEDKKEAAPTVNLKIPTKKSNNKSKLSIGKAPAPKTPPPKKDEAGVQPTENGAGGLSLKQMEKPKEAPRAQADQDKIQELKVGKKTKSTASPVYTAIAVIVFVAMGFSAFVAAAQYFNLWDLKTIGGKPIDVSFMKGIYK